MSILLPYSPSIVIDYFATKFSIDLSVLSAYETLSITILSNIYFFIYWFIIVYFVLKIFNRIWDRFF